MDMVAMLLHYTLQNVLNNSLSITTLSLFSLHVTIIISSYE